MLRIFRMIAALLGFSWLTIAITSVGNIILVSNHAISVTVIGLAITTVFFWITLRLAAEICCNQKKTNTSNLDESKAEEARWLVEQVMMILSNQKKEFQKSIQAIEEIGAVFSEVVKGSEQTLTRSMDMQVGANQGLNQVQEMRLAMQEIELADSDLKEIQNIINAIAEKTTVIDSIVFKTQLLSFNAAIEAALAGEKGLGFSVVASEVGMLADNSGRAADEIANLLDKSRIQTIQALQNIGNRISAGRVSSEKCSHSFTSIHSIIVEIVPMIEIIKRTSEMQKAGLQETQNIFENLQRTNTQVQDAFTQLVEFLPQLVSKEHLQSMVHDLTPPKIDYENIAS